MRNGPIVVTDAVMSGVPDDGEIVASRIGHVSAAIVEPIAAAHTFVDPDDDAIVVDGDVGAIAGHYTSC